MKSDILNKLTNHLCAGIKREADAVYLLIEIGKYLEQDKNLSFPLIKFYRNWVAHSNIDHTSLAGEIASTLDNALVSSKNGDTAVMIQKVMKVISKETLRTELEKFFEITGLPKNILNDQTVWTEFVRLLICVLIDVPVVFDGLTRLSSLKFRKDRNSNYILCEINDTNESGITFVWTQLRV